MSAATCGRCQTLLDEGDLRCSVCALIVPVALESAHKEKARILRCTECAAAVSYSVEAQAPRCGFCAAVMAVEQPVDPVEQAEWVLPFGVDREQARHSLVGWLKSLGWFRPSDLASGATIDSLHPLHWAGWIFDAQALVTWTADSDAGSGRSAWAPHSGSTRFSWNNIVVSASRGLEAKEVHRLAEGYNLQTARHPDQAPGSIIEGFDLQRSAARKTIVDAIERNAVAQLAAQGHIPGRKFRNVHVSVLLARLVTKRVALPAWVLAYRYRGGLFRAIVHGQDPKIAFGRAPVSWTKIMAVVIGGVALLALIALIIVLAAK